MQIIVPELNLGASLLQIFTKGYGITQVMESTISSIVVNIASRYSLNTVNWNCYACSDVA